MAYNRLFHSTKQHWTKSELADNWTFSKDELDCINKKTSKLVFAIKMKFFDLQGYFPNIDSDIPIIVLEYIANQLALEIKDVAQYRWQSRIAQLHNQEIREYYGYRKINDSDYELIKQLVKKIFLIEASPINRIIAEVYKLLKKNKVEPPFVQEIYKYVNSIYTRCEQQFFDDCLGTISVDAQNELLKLLHLYNDDDNGNDNDNKNNNLINNTILNFLRSSAGKVSSDTLVEELEKLSYIKLTGISNNKYFDQISKKLLKKYHDKVAISSPSWLLRIKKFNQSKFYTLLACFCRYKGAKIIDNLAEIFIRKVRKMQRAAKIRAKEELWEYYTDLDKDSLLFQMVDISLTYPDGVIKDKIYNGVGGKDKLEQSRKSKKSSRRLAGELEYKHLGSLYTHHHRKYLLLLLKNLELNNYIETTLLNVIRLIVEYIDDKKFLNEYYPDDHEIVEIKLLAKEDLEIIKNTEGKFKRVYYELAILNLLANYLKCKNVWINGAAKYSDPDKDLPQDFQHNKNFYYDTLNLPHVVEEFTKARRNEMTTSIRNFNNSIVDDDDVNIGLKRGKPHIYLTPYTIQEEPQNIKDLKQEVASIWSNTSLLDILKEADLRVGFTKELINTVDKTSIPQGILQQRLLLCLFSMATNTEFKKVCAGIEGIKEADLSYVKKRFLTVESLRHIIAKLVNSTLSIRNKDIWGEVITSFASDSMKFASLEENLMSEYHIRYKGNGILAYWHVDRKALCISSQIMRCSTSEIASMLYGIIHHASNAKVKNHSTDTHGQSLIAFAFARLLGINLRPRIKGLGKIKLNKVDANMAQADYCNLKEVMDRPIKWPLIESYYDEMVKNAAALFTGTADVEVILKKFIVENSRNPLYQAMLELGRVERTTYLCQYLSIKELRIEIEEVLNVVENWNSGTNFTFFGKRGIISSNDEIDQELSILALHLQQLSLTHINTLMLQQILKKEEWKNKLTIEDKRAITPLFYNHINQYGTYKLDMRERLIIEEA